jgi:hypothetical protein
MHILYARIYLSVLPLTDDTATQIQLSVLGSDVLDERLVRVASRPVGGRPLREKLPGVHLDALTVATPLDEPYPEPRHKQFRIDTPRMKKFVPSVRAERSEARFTAGAVEDSGGGLFRPRFCAERFPQRALASEETRGGKRW